MFLGANNDLSISGNTFTGGAFSAINVTGFSGLPANNRVSIDENNLEGNGTGIRIGTGSNGGTGINANFNRLDGNTVAIRNFSDATIDATNNWFGCNEGPSSATTGCSIVDSTPPTDGTAGAVDADPFLVLTLSSGTRRCSSPTGCRCPWSRATRERGR